ncbi:MAG: carboxypeptidase-like regulatory domain-containing protein [Gallionella sp.]|nr:carboxypeptidase-like regulatory domain-containing protein [Gallionella sp.]MDD4947317.1 carboxypeptidase-like regulatory domain-containing protein [Gallionella sp.]MDD5612271.1 carboxypeptidase-like regulatory domain-containing protein [Gallionella sp.]
MEKYIRKMTENGNWFWLLVYSAIFAYFVARLLWLPGEVTGNPQCITEKVAFWLHFKQSVTLPLAILLGAIFVHMFSNPIAAPPTEGLGEQDKSAVLAQALAKQSLQRRNWMIFAYSFMLVALLVPIYTFGPGWDSGKVLSLERSNDLTHPVGIFVGCSRGQQKGELSCPATSKGDNKPRTTADKPASSVPPTTTIKGTKSDGKNTPASGVPATPAQKPDKPEAESGGAWVLNLGGHVSNAASCKTADGAAPVCEVHGGLLVPIYVIILALIGGGISLTRRLPEYQNRANPEFISTAQDTRLTQHEFREYLVFQMVQFISAPFLAILAYFLVDPSNTVASVVLAFSAGFASESILLMVRALTQKFTPNDDVPASGTLSGIVTHVEGGIANPIENAEVSLASAPQMRTLTDKSGFYLLGNVPLGEHGIKVAADGYQPAGGSVRVEQAQQIVTKHWTLAKPA